MIVLDKGESIQGNSAVALGLFDGVHAGHRKVIEKVIDSSKEGFVPTVFTFRTGSMKRKHDRILFYIYNDDVKCDIFRKLGVEYVCSPGFDEMKDMSAEDFARVILKGRLNAQKVVCGHNFHFGKGGVYGFEELNFLGRKYGFEVYGIEGIMYDGKNVSSALIRECIKIGEIETANRMLVENYFIEQNVMHGNQLGRKLNFPTVNQYFEERQLIPQFGVYASLTTVDGVQYHSVTNIGIKPTIQNKTDPLAETHILGYSGNLYDRRIKVELVHFVRGEHKFDSLDELKMNIRNDIDTVSKYMQR